MGLGVRSCSRATRLTAADTGMLRKRGDVRLDAAVYRFGMVSTDQCPDLIDAVLGHVDH